jgi:hypothetical protein
MGFAGAQSILAGSIKSASSAHRAVGLGRNAHRAAFGVRHADHRVVVRRCGARLERLENHALIAGPRAYSGPGIYANELDACRHAEWHGGLVGQCHLHEISYDRGSKRTASLAVAEVVRLVVAEIHPHHEIGREADEPRVLLVIGSSTRSRLSTSVGSF